MLNSAKPLLQVFLAKGHSAGFRMYGSATGQYDLWRTFDCHPVVTLVFVHCRHALAVGIKWVFAYLRCFFKQFLAPNATSCGCDEQSDLCWIADPGLSNIRGLLQSGIVAKRSRGEQVVKQCSRSRLNRSIYLNVGISQQSSRNRHVIFGQCARLVGKDHASRSQRFDSRQFGDQGVPFRHSPHATRQRYGGNDR